MGPEQTCLLFFFFFNPLAYLGTDCDWGSDAERWFMIVLALDVLPCSCCIQCDCASKRWSMSIVLGRSGPKLRLSENFLNYSALILTVWALLLKELSLPSLLPSPLDNLNHELLSLFPSTSKKNSKITLSIHKRVYSVREHCLRETNPCKVTSIVDFPRIFLSNYFTTKFFKFKIHFFNSRVDFIFLDR